MQILCSPTMRHNVGMRHCISVAAYSFLRGSKDIKLTLLKAVLDFNEDMVQTIKICARKVIDEMITAYGIPTAFTQHESLPGLGDHGSQPVDRGTA